MKTNEKVHNFFQEAALYASPQSESLIKRKSLISTVLPLNQFAGRRLIETGQPMADVGHHLFEELIGQRHLDVDFLSFHVRPRHFLILQLPGDENINHVVAFTRVNPKLQFGITT